MWNTNLQPDKQLPRPLALSFSVPEGFSESTSSIQLVDRFTARFQMNPPLVIADNMCANLIQASFAYSQPNIAAAGILESEPNGNNRISINWDGAGYIDIELETGLYDYLDVQFALNQEAINQGWSDGSADLFILTGVSATQKIIFEVDPASAGGAFPAGGVLISFENPSPADGSNDSIGPILGFPTSGIGSVITIPGGQPTPERIEAPNVAGFSDVSAYVLYMSVVTNSYQNGRTGQLLYSFPLGNSTPNSVVAYQATLNFPVQVTSGVFSAIDVWTTDQSGDRLPWAYYQAPFQFSAILAKNKQDGSV